MGNHQHHPRLNYCNHLMAFFLRQLFHVCPWPRPRKTQLNTGRLKKLSGTQSRWDLCIHADGVSCRGACCDWRLHSVFHCVLCSPFVAVMVDLFPLNSCWWRLNSPADPWVISTVRTLFWKTFTRKSHQILGFFCQIHPRDQYPHAYSPIHTEWQQNSLHGLFSYSLYRGCLRSPAESTEMPFLSSPSKHWSCTAHFPLSIWGSSSIPDSSDIQRMQPCSWMFLCSQICGAHTTWEGTPLRPWW